MLLNELQLINRIYNKIEETIADILDNDIEKDVNYDVSSYFNLAIHDIDCQNVFNSPLIPRSDCLLLYNPFTKEYKIKDLNFVTKQGSSNNTMHITWKDEFVNFWHNLITGNLAISDTEMFIKDSIINDVVMGLFSEIEYHKNYLKNYTPVTVQSKIENVYIYIEAFNCNKLENIKVSPRIIVNILAGTIIKDSLIKSFGYIIDAYLKELDLNCFTVRFNKKHRTFIKTENHHIYFDIIFETDYLVDLINMFVYSWISEFSHVRNKH